MAHLTNSYPLPKTGEVFFYLLTDTGVLTASGSEPDMRSGRHPLSQVGNAAQKIIAEYRRIQPPM